MDGLPSVLTFRQNHPDSLVRVDSDGVGMAHFAMAISSKAAADGGE